MTLDCVGLTQFIVMWIIHRNVGVHLPKYLFFSNICFFKGSVETHLWGGGIQ